MKGRPSASELGLVVSGKEADRKTIYWSEQQDCIQQYMCALILLNQKSIRAHSPPIVLPHTICDPGPSAKAHCLPLTVHSTSRAASQVPGPQGLIFISAM